MTHIKGKYQILIVLMQFAGRKKNNDLFKMLIERCESFHWEHSFCTLKMAAIPDEKAFYVFINRQNGLSG